MSSRFRSLAPAVVAVALTSALAVSSTRSRCPPPARARRARAAPIRSTSAGCAPTCRSSPRTSSKAGTRRRAGSISRRATWPRGCRRSASKPGGDDGGYFQRFGTTRRTVDPAKATLTLGERTFSYGDDFLASAPGTAEGAARLRRPRLRREEEERRRLRRRRREGQDRRRPLRLSGRRHPRRPARRVRARHLGEPGELCGPPRRPRRRARARLRDPGRLAHQPRQRRRPRAGR